MPGRFRSRARRGDEFLDLFEGGWARFGRGCYFGKIDGYFTYAPCVKANRTGRLRYGNSPGIDGLLGGKARLRRVREGGVFPTPLYCYPAGF